MSIEKKSLISTLKTTKKANVASTSNIKPEAVSTERTSLKIMRAQTTRALRATGRKTLRATGRKTLRANYRAPIA